MSVNKTRKLIQPKHNKTEIKKKKMLGNKKKTN